MVVAINYADKNFESQRIYNSRTAIKKGKVDKIVEYSPRDIDHSFKKKNSEILSYKRGAGLWLWKPYIIYNQLAKLNEGDYLFYCDSGAIFVNKVSYLVDALEQSGQSIMGFELPLLERQFTKKETFVSFGEENFDRNQMLATYILFKKDNTSLKFVNEWLGLCCKEELISPKKFNNCIEEFKDFLVHREDQSIFSLLYHKYKLLPFREASQYGDRPFEHIWIPAYNWSKPWEYVKVKEYKNSNYPRVIVSCRKKNPRRYLLVENVKTILSKLGVYNQKVYEYLKK